MRCEIHTKSAVVSSWRLFKCKCRTYHFLLKFYFHFHTKISWPILTQLIHSVAVVNQPTFIETQSLSTIVFLQPFAQTPITVIELLHTHIIIIIIINVIILFGRHECLLYKKKALAICSLVMTHTRSERTTV